MYKKRWIRYNYIACHPEYYRKHLPERSAEALNGTMKHFSRSASTARWRTRVINFGIGSITIVLRQDMVCYYQISATAEFRWSRTIVYSSTQPFKSWRSWVINIGNGSIWMVWRCWQLVVWANMRKNTFLVDQLNPMIKFGLEMLIVDTGILLCGPILNQYLSWSPAQSNDQIRSGDVDCWYW